MRIPAILFCLVALFALSHRARAAESYANCTGTVTSLPQTITTPGVWCLKQTLAYASTTSNALVIAADNVTLDCNDFTISAPPNSSSTAIGIYGTDRLNTTVRHCNVQNFFKGIFLHSTGAGGGHVVEDNTFGASFSIGIQVEGDGSIVRRNIVFAVGSSGSLSLIGIRAAGSVNITDNTIDGVDATVGSGSSAYGIYTTGNPDGTIDGNRVRNLFKDGAGKIYGIFNASSGRISIRDNDLFGDGSKGSTGVACTDAAARAKNNMINGFATPLLHCGKAGENDVAH